MKALHMEHSSDSVIQSILNHPKIKLKKDNIRSPEEGTISVTPPLTDRSKLYFELHTLKSILPKVVVKGISTVERAVINRDKGKYHLLVEGTNLLAVMGSPGVNASKTKSNHVIEVQQTLGIEAARQSIINEIQFTMKQHGMSIDVRHMMLFADVMTYKGKVLGLTRFGITEMKDSVLMLAAFEKSAEHLFNGSFNGTNDQIEGVTECIIMGIPMKLGTGMLKVKQRVELLPELTYGPDPILSMMKGNIS